MNKAQMEMAGLIIVALLLMIGALFFVRFGVFKERDESVDNSVKLIQAINLRESISRFSVCGNVSMIDALAVCKSFDEVCKGYGCKEIKKDIAGIIEKSLGYFEETEDGSKSFGFFAYNIGSDEPFASIGKCKVEELGEGVKGFVSSGKKTYIGDNGKVAVQINLC